MAEAGAKDVDRDWREVPDSTIEKLDLSLNFLDPIGLRYYLSVYMIWQLKQSEGWVPWVDCNTHGAALFSLGVSSWSKARGRRTPDFAPLTPEQARAINRFLHFYATYGEDSVQRQAQQALTTSGGSSTESLLKAAIAQFNLSGRGYDRILKVSRAFINCLEDARCVEMHHVPEAINYRAFDRKLFG